MAGLKVQRAIDGRDIVLILAAALEEEAGLDVVAADEFREVFLDIDDAVEIVELAGAAFRPLKPAMVRVGMSLVIPYTEGAL